MISKASQGQRIAPLKLILTFKSPSLLHSLMKLLLWKCQILNFTLLLNLKEGTFLLLGFCISILLSLLRPSLLLQFEFGLSGKKKRSRWLRNGSLIAIVFAPLFSNGKIFSKLAKLQWRNAMIYAVDCGWWIGIWPHHCFCFGLCIINLYGHKKQQYDIPQ